MATLIQCFQIPRRTVRDMRLGQLHCNLIYPSFPFQVMPSIVIFEGCAVTITVETLEAVMAAKLANNFRFRSCIKDVIVSGETGP